MERQTSKPNSGTPLPIRLTARVSRIDLRVADLPRLLYPVNADKRVRTLSFFFCYLFLAPPGGAISPETLHSFLAEPEK